MGARVLPIKVGVVGATGYSGRELRQLLERDTRTFQVSDEVPRDGWADPEVIEKVRELDLVFLCTPNEVSAELAPRILALGVSVIDVSGAFRLDPGSYPEWYGFSHPAPEWLAQAEYGLYPWYRVRRQESNEPPRLIANPGCYATAINLVLLPLLRRRIITPQKIFIDAKSGTSGAGRKAAVELLFSEVYGEFRPYRVGRHQHWPEIVMAAKNFADAPIHPVLVTELLPVERGISAALFLDWADGVAPGEQTAAHLVSAYREFYEGDPSIQVGTDPSAASIKAVQKTNRVLLQATVAFGQPLVFVALDNLVRGAAGQALMNAYQWAGEPLPEFLQ